VLKQPSPIASNRWEVLITYIRFPLTSPQTPWRVQVLKPE
jgi:hypothetical protein